MKSAIPLLQTIYDGTRTFLRDDFSDEVEFTCLVADLRRLDALGFLKGYCEHFSKDSEKRVVGVAASHGLSDEGKRLRVAVVVQGRPHFNLQQSLRVYLLYCQARFYTVAS